MKLFGLLFGNCTRICDLCCPLEFDTERGLSESNDVHGCRSGEDSLMVVGDAIVIDILSVPHPDWVHPFDQDHSAAVNTRYSILEEVADTDQRLILFHGDFPGIGRVLKTNGTYEFRKARYEL